ncbi:pentapeptide repeat-containing protein [Streptomyces yunnanensis]|uniref:Pentapeptide repeat-containing protein n=1 Tax=Streptomyces yunnanensis TaxID=156453 RepID=A0ABY8A393_9ACTN|nr:pentapeptide repeat-containing protein [Streptomyces yunnanensis]WEB38781.1 pentapeptide repeat-containing protein [Streptomyces yunnanensis]
MDTITFGRVRLTLPGLDEPGLYLSNVGTLDSPRGMVQDFAYSDADLRSLDITDTQLITGRISGVRSKRTQFEALNLHGVEITRSDLGTIGWSESKLTRVVLRDCKLMGATLDGLVLDDVLFEGCKLDFATFEKVRATGPVAFVNCVLSEATFTDCDLTDVVFSECTLRLTEFEAGRYRGTDLRGNDLATIRGLANLKKVRIDPGQEADLAQALVAELDITLGED